MDGTELDFTFIEGPEAPCGVALNGSHVFWADRAIGSIGRARLDGSEVDVFFAGAFDPCGVALNETHIFWASDSTDAIGRVKLDGGENLQSFVSGASVLCGVAVSGSHVFWGSPEAIGRANLNGTDPEPEFIPGLNGPCSLAVHVSHLYWAEKFSFDASVVRALLDGTGIDRNVVTNLSQPCGIAVNSAPVVLRPPPRLLSTFVFGNTRQARRQSAAFVPVDLPEPGTLRVHGASPGVRVELLSEVNGVPDGIATNAGRRWLKVWPGAKGAAGKRLRERIWRQRRALTMINVEYTAVGRLPAAKTKRVWLVRSAREGGGQRSLREYCSHPTLSRRKIPGLHVRIDLRGRLFRQGDRVFARLENFGSLGVSYGAPFDLERRNDWSWAWPPTPSIAWPKWRRELPSGFASGCMSFTISEDFPPGDYSISKRIEYSAPRLRQSEEMVWARFSVLP